MIVHTHGIWTLSLDESIIESIPSPCSIQNLFLCWGDVHIGEVRQHSPIGEDLEMCVKCLHGKNWLLWSRCRRCLGRWLPSWHNRRLPSISYIFFNLTIFKLMKVARRISESVKRTAKSNVFPVLPTFLSGEKTRVALLQQWIKNEFIQFLDVELRPTTRDSERFEVLSISSKERAFL